MFGGYGLGQAYKDCAHPSRSRNKNANEVNITGATKFVRNKGGFLVKQGIIQLIMGRFRQRGCEVIQAEGDVDVEIAKVAVTKSTFKSTTLVGEDTDHLLLLLYYAEATNCTELYFC